jgi:hypothetical protein
MHLDRSDSRTFNGRTTNYQYRDYPDGYEIDLIASGWYNASPRLDYKEDGDKDKPNAGDLNVECPEEGNPKSLHWLPRLSTVSGRIPLKVKASLVDPNPSPRDVLARIEMKDGTLAASVRAQVAKYEFVVPGPNNNHKQAVADYLDYTFPAYMKSTDTYFVLVGRKFKSDPPEYQELARVKPVGTEVVLTLANVMEHDFFHPMITNTLPHFSDYYSIIDSPPVKGEPRFVKNCENSGADSGVECGPDRAP